MSEFSKLKQQRKAKEAKSYTPAVANDADINSSESGPILNSDNLYSSLPPVLDVRVDEEKGRGIYSKIYWKPGE